MSVAEKNKLKSNQSKENFHVLIKKKSIENGDLSKWLKDKLPKREKPLTIKQKIEREEKEYSSTLKAVKRNQEKSEVKRKTVGLENRNKNVNPSAIRRLPKTIQEIEENEELVELLLKDPQKMSEEEQTFIKSLSDQEFKLFAKFLQQKEKELSWRGNDWGSGRYSKQLVSIYRATDHSENERLLSLKQFLKVNNANNKSNGLEVIQKHILHSNFTKHDEYKLNYEEKKNSANEKEETLNTLYKNTSRLILNELENFKNVIVTHRNEIKHQKVEMQNKTIVSDLERKSKLIKDDIKKMHSKEEDVNSLYETFRDKNKLNGKEDSQEISPIKKIQSYIQRLNISAFDLVKQLDKNAAESLKVNTTIAKETLIRLNILNPTEAESFLNLIKLYHGEIVKIDYIVCVIESEVYDDIQEILRENEEGEDSESQVDSDQDYDYFSAGSHHEHRHNKINNMKNLTDFDYFMKKKSASLIQTNFRGYLLRKHYFSILVCRNLMAKRISRKLRVYCNQVKQLRNDSAKKITYLFRKHYILRNLGHKLFKTTEKWLRGGKNLASLPFSHKNKAKYALKIQRAFRAYKKNIMTKFYDKNSTTMDINMLKTKTCLICLVNRVTHLCKDCENNHYCESCFLKFHLRGAKRNHTYLKIKSLLEDYKKKRGRVSIVAEAYNEVTILKNYLEENNFNLYELFKIWDFKKDKTILYKHLKDCLNVKGFKFDPNIRESILNLALRFVVDDAQKFKNIDNSYVNYESLWLEIV